MRSLSGFLLLAGVGVGLFVYLPAPVDRDISLDLARRNAQQTIAEKQPRPLPAAVSPINVRTFSPSVQLSGLARNNATAHPAIIKVVGDTGTTQGEWQTSVGVAPANRYELVADIQKQLKRLGCYYGRIDGSWGEGTKSALAYFNGRVNAALPVDAPDQIQLTLLKAHNGKTCGDCPVGQVASADGRCVAQTAGYGSQRTTTQSVATQETLPWKTTTQAAAQAPAGQPLFRPVPTSVISTEPLPGRMAIGGPRELAPAGPAYTQPNYNAYAPPPGAPAVAAVEQGNEASPPPSSSQPKRRGSSRDRRGFDGSRPGSATYNLMLSLGGVY